MSGIIFLGLIIIGVIYFFIWGYKLDPKCPKGGRCTGHIRDFDMGSYKDSGMTFHYGYNHTLYCKKCGRIYKRKDIKK